MTAATHRGWMRRAAANMLAAGCLLLTGCAGLSGAGQQGASLRDPHMDVQSAQGLLTPGTTRADEIQGTLGAANVVHFDSGFEVWVYRAPSGGSPGTMAEMVLLIDPNRVLRKVRVRMPTPSP